MSSKLRTCSKACHLPATPLFFARGGGDVGNAGKFVTSIAIQLASGVSAVRQHVSNAVSEHSDITSLSFRDQWQMLVLTPLSKLEDNNRNTSYILVVDALDECDDDRNIGIILQLLADARALKAAQLRVLLTSNVRPWMTRNTMGTLTSSNLDSV